MLFLLSLQFLSIFASWWHTSAFDPMDETIIVQQKEGYAGRISDTCFVLASGKSLSEVCVTYLFAQTTTKLPFKFERNVISASTNMYTTHFVDEGSNVYKVTKDNGKINVKKIGRHIFMSQFFSFGNIGVGCSSRLLDGCMYCVNDECTTKYFGFGIENASNLGYNVGFSFPNYATDTLYVTINSDKGYFNSFCVQNVKSWNDYYFIESDDVFGFNIHKIGVSFPYGQNAFIIGDEVDFLSIKFQYDSLKYFSYFKPDYNPLSYQGAFAITGVNYPYVEWVLFGSGGVYVVRSYAQCGKNQYWDMGVCYDCLPGRQCLLGEVY